jgi:hypothetical protein
VKRNGRIELRIKERIEGNPDLSTRVLTLSIDFFCLFKIDTADTVILHLPWNWGLRKVRIGFTPQPGTRL